MTIYPKKVRVSGEKYGNQILPEEYAPVPLDSERNAVERMLVALDEDRSKEHVIACGLNGSDEVGTVARLLKEILAEGATMEAVNPAACKDEEDYRAKLMDTATSHLDVDTWVSRKITALGGVMPYGVDVAAKEL